MTRIGIMSMQRIFNYGSSLQSYSLKRLFEESAEDVRVSFIDYHAGKPLVTLEEPTAPGRRALAKITEYTAVKSSWMDRLRFLNHKRRYADRYFPSLGITAERNYDTAVDLHVIGSDEVFNCVQANTNVGFSRDLFGHTSTATRLISYAASFGNTTLSRIEEYGIRSKLSDDLSRFDAISVRDENSAGIIEKLTGTVPAIHVDPVLAYAGLLSEPAVPQRRLYAEKYVLLYGYAGRISRAESASVKDYARRIGAHVLCFGGVQEAADRFIDCSPFELLAYFRDAEAVITDTFHGTILALINSVPFAALVRRSVGNGYGNEQKLLYLLDTFGVRDRQLADPSGLAQLLAEPLDNAAIRDRLAEERKKSQSYLGHQVQVGRQEVQLNPWLTETGSAEDSAKR